MEEVGQSETDDNEPSRIRLNVWTLSSEDNIDVWLLELRVH